MYQRKLLYTPHINIPVRAQQDAEARTGFISLLIRTVVQLFPNVIFSHGIDAGE